MNPRATANASTDPAGASPLMHAALYWQPWTASRDMYLERLVCLSVTTQRVPTTLAPLRRFC